MTEAEALDALAKDAADDAAPAIPVGCMRHRLGCPE